MTVNSSPSLFDDQLSKETSFVPNLGGASQTGWNFFGNSSHLHLDWPGRAGLAATGCLD